jgi:hypothetical protein
LGEKQVVEHTKLGTGAKNPRKEIEKKDEEFDLNQDE